MSHATDNPVCLSDFGKLRNPSISELSGRSHVCERIPELGEVGFGNYTAGSERSEPNSKTNPLCLEIITIVCPLCENSKRLTWWVFYHQIKKVGTCERCGERMVRNWEVNE